MNAPTTFTKIDSTADLLAAFATAGLNVDACLAAANGVINANTATILPTLSDALAFANNEVAEFRASSFDIIERDRRIYGGTEFVVVTTLAN